MFLLQHGGVTASDANSSGRTALLKAANHGHIDLVKELLKKNPATIEQTDEHGFTAVLCAADNGHHQLVKWLFSEAGALNSTGEYCTALSLAIQSYAPLDHVKWLVDGGYSSLKEVSFCDVTVTMLAAINFNADLLEWLVKEKGMDLNAQCPRGMSALMLAARHGKLESVKWLLIEGSDISQADAEGKTALIHAADYTKGFGCDPLARQRVVLWLLEVHKQAASDELWNVLRWSTNLNFLFKRKSSSKKRKTKRPHFLLNGIGWGEPSALFRCMLKSGPPPVSPTTILEQPSLDGLRLQDVSTYIDYVCSHAAVLRLNLPLWQGGVNTIVSAHLHAPLVELVMEYCSPSTDEFWSIKLGLSKQNGKKRKATRKKGRKTKATRFTNDE